MKTYARIDGGVVAELFSTDGDIATMFNSALVWVDVTAGIPRPQVGWSYDGASFAPPASPTASQIKAQKIALIDAQYDAKIEQGVTWNGHLWHAHAKFQGELGNLISLFNNGIIPTGSTASVRTKDNGAIPLTLDQLKQLAGVLFQYIKGVYDWSWAEKDKL